MLFNLFSVNIGQGILIGKTYCKINYVGFSDFAVSNVGNVIKLAQYISVFEHQI